MVVISFLLAVLGGSLNTVQSGANAALQKAIGQPLATALIVSAVNAAVYLALIPVLGIAWPGARFAQVPWWAWFGGALGAVYVLSVIYFAEKLGAATFTGLSVAAALITSVILDHFGWVGFQQHTAGLWRILGCALMVGGLGLIAVF